MSKFQSILCRVVGNQDFYHILSINAEGQPGVAALDRAELLRLASLADYMRVLEIDGQVVGYFIAFLKTSNYDGEEFQWFQKRSKSKFLYIDQVAIAKKYRGNGLAKEFYKSAEQYAIQFSISELVCEVNIDPPNPTSLKFHTSLSFNEITQLTTQDGRRVSLLSKNLNYNCK